MTDVWSALRTNLSISILYDIGSYHGHVTGDIPIYKQWQEQSDFAFGFIPHGEQAMPDVVLMFSPVGVSPFNTHALVRATRKPNYMGAM